MNIEIQFMDGRNIQMNINSSNDIKVYFDKNTEHGFNCVELFSITYDVNITKSKFFFNMYIFQEDELLYCNILAHPRIINKNIVRIYDDTNCCAWDIEEMENLFGYIKNWNTSWVTDMSYAFFQNYGFSYDISDWKTSNVWNMQLMFESCFEFNSYINNWDTSNVISMYGMFQNCIIFNQPLSNWNVENVETTSNMFFGAKKFNQDLNNWKLSSIETVTGMFFGCSSLEQKLFI